MWSFRPTPEAMAFVDALVVRDGASKTMTVVRCLEQLRDAQAALGDDWWELERQARVEGVGVGSVLGRLAKAALEKGRKK